MKETLNELTNPRPDQIDADPIDWLERLAGPTVIWIDGRESARTRAVVTLLHGNEPSGLLAIHSILRSGEVPLTNLLLVIVSVEAALLEPRFRYRAYPQERDMNRSFPGSERGSLAGRMAHMFFNQVAVHCTHIIDLHTGAIHRTNLPQIRANLEDEATADMAKAFGAGGDFVMVGGQFAGHDQNPGEITVENNKKYKLFYGMSSNRAQETHYGKMNTYRSSEGRVMKIPYKGDLNKTVLDYLGGLRSTCTYINAKSIKQIAKCTTFVRVSQQVNNFFGDRS